MKTKPHPQQPVVIDDHGTPRFKQNAIVHLLLKTGRFDMNTLAMMNFTDEDRDQFAQLIGYSVDGYRELDYVSAKSRELAWIAAKKAQKQ